MKNFMLTLLMLVGMTTFGQESEPKVLDWNTPIVKVNNTTYELVDVDEWGSTEIKFTRFNDNGEVIERGRLLNNKPHGTWKSYNPRNGEVMATAYYHRGERQKLEAWSDGKLYTVVYKDKIKLN
tara:strand:+ start:200 stop:571 length:372 start_codon:yes stop_codon:yes gene_type:complete